MIYTLLIPKGNDIEIAFVEGFCTKILSHSSNKKAKKIAWVHTDLINNHWITSVYKNKQEEKNLIRDTIKLSEYPILQQMLLNNYIMSIMQ